MKAHLSPRDLALTLAIVALWDFTFVPIKVGLREMPPFRSWRPQMPWRYIAVYGFAIGVCQFGLPFSWG